ncbi:MAG: amidohydrolase family protein [Pseudomonadota bacterium]
MTWLRNSVALLAAVAGVGAASGGERATLIRGARVFDGSGAPAVVENVLIRGDRIVAVGKHVRAPAGSNVIDARGLTLIPGLHDLHTHMRSPAFDGPDDLPKSYAGYLSHGVTTVNEFSVSGEMLEPIREMTGSGAVTAPNLKLAIRFGVPGGHGTEYGWGNFFTLQVQTPRAAHLAMVRALTYKPDVIKVFADGWRYGRGPGLDSMNQPTLAAIVRDAHAADIPVITHTVTLAGAKLAAAAGVDAVGHGVGDALVDDELIALMKARGTAYIPTLVVYEPQQDRAFEPAEWRALRPPERAQEEERLAKPIEAIPELEAKRWAIMQENIRRLKAAGVRIGVGTDAGIGGVYHGSATLREIRWLTRLGHSPAEALIAATATSAGILREGADHGRIAVGQRADLVLTGGKPDERIDDLYDVRRVFVSGREVPLKPLRTALDGAAMSPLPVHLMTGPIDTGAGPAGRTDLDTLPVESTDSGADHSHLDFARPDHDADKRLFMVAQMGSAPKPFAQLILPLTRGAVQLADARGFTGVAFEARGGGQYRLLFDSYGLDNRADFEAPFAADQSRRDIRIPFSAFRSRDDKAVLDLARLRALIVRLDGSPDSKAWLELANLRFYRADP